MKARILVGFDGSPDGIRVEKYREGEVVDLPPRLFEIAAGEGWVEAAAEPAAPVRPPESKPAAPPETKVEAEPAPAPRRRGRPRKG